MEAAHSQFMPFSKPPIRLFSVSLFKDPSSLLEASVLESPFFMLKLDDNVPTRTI